MDTPIWLAFCYWFVVWFVVIAWAVAYRSARQKHKGE